MQELTDRDRDKIRQIKTDRDREATDRQGEKTVTEAQRQTVGQKKGQRNIYKQNDMKTMRPR